MPASEPPHGPPILPSPRPVSSLRLLTWGLPQLSSLARRYHLIHGARTKPWGQITAHLLSPESLLVAVCRTPALQYAVVRPL